MEINKILKISNLSHCYKNGKSIKNINLDVSPSDVVCILGPSGCGKTTLLRLIAGFEEPLTGEIKIGKEVVFGNNYVPTEKRSIGMLFQDIALFPHLSVKENVGFSLIKNNVENDKLIVNLLKKVGLEGFLDRYSSNMSGGEQQRVALARSLANKPNIMLLDEPFGSLDAWSKYDIAYDIINILKEQEAGGRRGDVCRRRGIFYKWKPMSSLMLYEKVLFSFLQPLKLDIFYSLTFTIVLKK